MKPVPLDPAKLLGYRTASTRGVIGQKPETFAGVKPRPTFGAKNVA